MTNATIITVTIYLIFVQYMKHKLLIMQEHGAYDLMTISVQIT